MGANPIPIEWQGLLDQNTTQHIILRDTAGLFVQTIIFSVDNGDIRISGMNFIKTRNVTLLDGTTNIAPRTFKTVQNQAVWDFFRGIVLNQDIEMTLVENGNLADTEFQITIIPSRKGEFPFSGKGTQIVGQVPTPGPGPAPG